MRVFNRDDMVQSPSGHAPTIEHALEPGSGHGNGITFVNDSKGTNVDATLKALHSFRGASGHLDSWGKR